MNHCDKHCDLVHAQKMHELPDEYLIDVLPIAKKIALVLGCEDYNLLQVRIFQYSTIFDSLPRVHFSRTTVLSILIY